MTNLEPERAMLAEIHARGMNWKAIAHWIGVSSRDRLRKFSAGWGFMRFTKEQIAAIRKLKRGLERG